MTASDIPRQPGDGSALTARKRTPQRRRVARVERKVSDAVASLIERQDEVRTGYAMARDVAPGPEQRSWLRELQEEHERSLRRLRQYARRHGGVRPQHATLRGWCARARIFLTRFRSQAALDRALASQERGLCRAYERAVVQPEMPPELRSLLLGHLMVEHEHRRVFRDRREGVEDEPWR